MQTSFSTTGIFDLEKPQKYIAYILNAGFDSVMLDLSILHKSRQQTDQLVKLCGSNSVRFDAVRTPYLKRDTKRTDFNMLLESGKECLELCEKTGCDKLIVQPLFAGIAKKDIWQENRRYYRKLGELAKSRSIGILMQNQCRSINGHLIRGVCADASAAAAWIDILNEEMQEEIFGFCLDTGAANLCGQDAGEMAGTLGKRLKAVLVRECDGISEASRLPFTGMEEKGNPTDWRSLFRGLRRIDFDGLLIMDAGSTLRGFSHLLRPQLYPLVKSVADFFQWQIEMETHMKRYASRVLFGAGQMCRHYMECYGEQYPPLFTCDNNRNLWGTFCSGLEVKSPNHLRELPEDCVVIICNIYYKEIAKQLKEMGIKNIGTFNDEYLPVLCECRE